MLTFRCVEASLNKLAVAAVLALSFTANAQLEFRDIGPTVLTSNTTPVRGVPWVEAGGSGVNGNLCANSVNARWGLISGTSSFAIGWSAIGTSCENANTTNLLTFSVNEGIVRTNALGGFAAGTGGVSTGDGTALFPSYTFGNDPNTGFYSLAADQIGVTTGGVRSFNFNSTAGRLEGVTGTPFLQLDNAAGSCLNYTGAQLCVASNQVIMAGTSGLNLNATMPLNIANRLVLSGATPTISSGFGTTPSVTVGVTTAFRVNVGTGGVASSGVIGLPTATNGWNCTCNDITTTSATVFLCKQTANTTTTVTVGNFTNAGAAGAWAASDIVAVSCVGY